MIRDYSLYKFFTLFLLLICSLSVLGQDHIKITGTVRDAQTKELLPFATVTFVGNESIGTTTDLDGEYVLESRWGTASIIASYVGYESQVIKISSDSKKQRLIPKLG